MKECYKCGETKEKTEFSVNEKKKDGLNSECKECQKKYFKEYYKNNKEKCIKAVMQNNFSKKAFFDNLKIKTGCKHCGYKDHPAALQFHHTDPKSKVFNIGSNYHLPIEIIQQEIDKCIILCANCHKIEHCIHDYKNAKSIKHTKKRTKTGKITIIRPYKLRGRKKCSMPENLEQLLWEKPAEIIAKEIGVTGTYLSKYCKKNKIQKPPRGYWTKQKLKV